MNVRELSSDARQVWQTAVILQALRGMAFGFSVYTIGPLYYDQFAKVSTPQLAISMTAMMLGILSCLEMILEIPTGAIGDAIGRKWTIIASFVCYMLYFSVITFIPFSNSLPLTLSLGILSVIISAFAFTLSSGTFSAWCFDSWREKCRDIGYEHLLTHLRIAYLSCFALSSIAGVWLYVKDMPYWGFIAAAACCAVAAVFGSVEMQSEEIVRYLDKKKLSLTASLQRMGEIIGVSFCVFSRSKVILWLVAIYSLANAIDTIVKRLWPVYLTSHVPNESQLTKWIVLVTIFNITTMIGTLVLSKRLKQFGKKRPLQSSNTILRRCLVGCCSVCAILIIILAWLALMRINTLYFFSGALIMVYFASGLIEPCFDALINNHIPDNHAAERATILSMASLTTSLCVTVLAIPSGGTSGETTIIGWAGPAVILLIVATIGNRIIKRNEKKSPNILPEIDERRIPCVTAINPD